MPPKPLTRLDLDPAGCGMPNCWHDHSVLYLHPRCHPSPGKTEASYHKASGTLKIACAECKALVAEVQVAEAPRATFPRLIS